MEAPPCERGCLPAALGEAHHDQSHAGDGPSNVRRPPTLPQPSRSC